MKKFNTRPIAALLFVVVIIAVAAAGFKMQSDSPPPMPTATPSNTTPVVTMQTTTTPAPEMSAEPLYDPTTHENGYCEGNCWEGICPYFTGYPEPPFTYDDVVMVAKTVWGEARGCSPEEQRLVVWTVLQRVDAGGEFRNYTTIEAVVTRPNWFVGYGENNPIDTDIYTLCHNELVDWWHGAEPPTHEVYAPTAPYYFFDGDGTHNWFREEWR